MESVRVNESGESTPVPSNARNHISRGVERSAPDTTPVVITAASAPALALARRQAQAFVSPLFDGGGTLPSGVGVNPNYDYRHYFHGDDGARSDGFVGLVTIVSRFCALCALLCCFLVTSATTYAACYFIITPRPHASEPLYFDYTGTAIHPCEYLKPKPSTTTGTSRGRHQTGENLWETKARSDAEEGSRYRPKQPQESSYLHREQLQTMNDERWRRKHLQNLHEHQESQPDEHSYHFNEVPSHLSRPHQGRRREVMYADDSEEATCRNQHKNTPWAAVDLFARQNAWHATTDDVLPKPRFIERRLVPKAAHYVTVSLDLPESARNKRAGLFGVHVELQSSDGSSLASSVRMVQYPHVSEWVAAFRKGMLVLPLALGIIPEHRVVTVPSFRFFVESQNLPLQYLTVRLLTQTHQNPSQPTFPGDRLFPIEVTGGYIEIGNELGPIQLIMKTWFYTCFMIGTMCLFTIQSMVWLAIRAYLRHRNQFVDAPFYDEPICDLDPDGSQLEENGGIDGEANHDPDRPHWVHDDEGSAVWEDLNPEADRSPGATETPEGRPTEPVSVTNASVPSFAEESENHTEPEIADVGDQR